MVKAGKLVIISAPSGSGKTTIVKHVTDRIPSLRFSVSATNRMPRIDETDGTDYHFIKTEEFRKKIEAGEFIEWEEVYPGHYYGTLMSEVEKIWQKGMTAIFDVDVQGGIELKKRFGKAALSVFIMAPSVEELSNRLKKRGTDSEDKIEMRIAKAKVEMGFVPEFDVIIVNEVLEKAINETLEAIETFIMNDRL